MIDLQHWNSSGWDSNPRKIEETLVDFLEQQDGAQPVVNFQQGGR